MNSTDRWLTPAEVCEYIQITDKTLRRYIADGKIPAYRMGERLVRFKSSDIDALMTPITPTA